MKNLIKIFLTGLIVLSFIFGFAAHNVYAKSKTNNKGNSGKNEKTEIIENLKEKIKSLNKKIESDNKGKTEKSKEKEERKEEVKSNMEKKKNGSFEIKGAIKEIDLIAKTITIALTKKNGKLGLNKGGEQKFSANEKTIIRVNDVKLNFDELIAGIIIEAKGRNLNGTSTLNRVDVKQKRFEIQGEIKALNVSSNEIKVAVTRAEKLSEILNKETDIKVIKNAKITKNDERKTFESLMVGDRLNLKIFKAGTQIFTFKVVVRGRNQGTGGIVSTTTSPVATTTPPTATSTIVTATTTISITNAEFNPNSVEITKGSKVIFVNNDTAMHQPSSDPHPAHTDFPTFGTGTALNPSESFKFVFNSEMTFRYHDHLNPGLTGTIIVK